MLLNPHSISVLVLRPTLLSGYPAKPFDSERKSAPHSYFERTLTNVRVLSAGIEPTSAPSEGAILSIERREGALRIQPFNNTFTTPVIQTTYGRNYNYF